MEVQSEINKLQDEISEIQLEAAEALAGLTVESGTWSYGGKETLRKLVNVATKYERWYNSAQPLIKEYLPDRQEEFSQRYETVRMGLETDIEFIREKEIKSVATLTDKVVRGILFQSDLISSIPNRVEVEELKAKKDISSNIVSNEMQKAKQLFDDGNIRAAGVIAGVALERHLLTLCETSEQELNFSYMDGITSLAQTLSEANEIGEDDQRLLEYLSGIRNKCSHASQEEPEKREVERMLNQTDEFIRA